MNIIELLEQLSNDIVADAFTAISRAHIMSKEAIWPCIMKELPPEEQAEALGLGVQSLVRAKMRPSQANQRPHLLIFDRSSRA